MVAAAPAGRRSPGCSCTSPACTPPSPACCWPSPCRWCAATRPAARTPARARRALRAPHPAALGRLRRPGLRLLLRRRGRSAACPGSALAGRQRRDRHRGRPGRRQGDRHHRRPPGWSPASPAPQLDESLGWPDVVGLALLGGIGLHRLAAHHRARLRRGERALRPREGRHPGRHAARGPAGHGRPAAAQPPVPPDRRGGERVDADGRRRSRTSTSGAGPGRSPTADNSGCRAALGATYRRRTRERRWSVTC